VVVPLKGFKPQFGQQLSSFLQANNVSGYFSTIKVPPGFRGRVEENHGDLSLLFAPASYTQVAQNQNQANVATALDQFIPATSGDRLVVSTALDHLFASEYPDAFDAILPAFYQTVSSIGLTLVNTQSQLIDQRLDAIRIGADRGFSVQGLGNNVPIYKESAVDGESRVDAKKSVITSTLEDTHWGAWVMGSGIFGRNYSVQDLPNYRFSSGQFLAGADHRWNKYFSTGLFAGYQGAYATYPESGRVWMNGVTFGIYATFDARNGFYASTIVSGSYSNYSTRRSIEFGTIDRTARGDLDSGSVGTFLKVGYDFKVGGFTFGPVLSAIYRKRSGESEFAGWTAKSQQLATQRRWKTRIYVECFRGQNSFDSTGENVLEP
jgi:fibronectin-binding autotransporter adhesin